MKYSLKFTGACLAALTGIQLCHAGAFDEAKWTVFDAGIYQPAQLFSETANVYGMRLSLFMTENKDIYGMDAGLIELSRNSYGIQASAVNIADKDAAGLICGIFNSAGNRLFGGQLGLYNQSGMNYFDKTVRRDCVSRGVQIGWLNHVQAIFKGCQLGAANVSDSYFSGVQLGLGNFVRNDDRAFEDYDSVASTEAETAAPASADAKKGGADKKPADNKAAPAKAVDQPAKTPFTFQLGLLNFNPRGFLPVFPLFNFSW